MKNFKDLLIGTIGTILFSLFFAWIIIYGTSPEVWYEGEHDGECETLHGQDTCHCYERLVKAAHDEESKLKK